MDTFAASGFQEDADFQINVDEEIMNLCKKRPREGDMLEGDLQKIPRAITEDDDAFVSTLLGENVCGDEDATADPSTTFMANSPAVHSRMPTFEASMQQPSSMLQGNAVSSFDMEMKKPAAFDAASAQPPAILGKSSAVYSKMPAAEAPTAQPYDMPMANPNAGGDEDLKMPAAEAPMQKTALPTQFASLPSLSGMNSLFQPPPNMDMEKFVERWTCDVCKTCSFETFDEAHAHEIQCKEFHDAKKKSEEEQMTSEAAGVLTTLALCPRKDVKEDVAASKLPAMRHPAINLVPQGESSSMLSDYNNLLVRHIEFFYPSSDNRVGLRCIHCKDHPHHVTAATFFPSTIGSISSGLGTIGARHFGWGKCPFVQSETVQRMIETKKTSGLQTRSNGRVGLDAYCKNLAKQYGILDDENSGISWIEGTVPNFNITDDLLLRKLSTSSRDSSKSSSTDHSSATDSNSIASVLASMKNDVNIEARPFVPSDTENFWECNGCRSISFDFRAKGSVVYSVGEPPRSKIEGHLNNCTGRKPLPIPRSATIEPYYGEGVPSIKVKWDSSRSKRSSGRVRRSLDDVKPGVEDVPLCFQDDQQFTTEFAYFTMTKLKKCYLTKAGGSRGACPVGFPGLACGYCAGKPNERRFFYTSADHLRNSFSHIPSHMAECSACPTEVKVRLEELKALRNRQKSLLKPGAHKVFIDRVWERMHGPALSDDSDDEDTVKFDTMANKRKPIPSNVRTVSTALVQDTDRASTSDLTYFILLNVDPYKTLGQSTSEEGEDSCQIGFPGLVCRHCMKRKFFTTSSEHLGDLLLTISDHMAICKECPASVKSQMMSYKTTHETQLQQLQQGEHDTCMQRVWRRLIRANQDRAKPAATTAPIQYKTGAPIQYKTVDPNMPLVSAHDESLVTPFTYFTMQQVRGANLDNSGNGSRSAFDFGFPGLECRHCCGQPNSRRFFYRTAEILAGNYAHIPNHLMTCSACPSEVKRSLKELKEAHLTLKHTLPKGSQKDFFNSVWERLHGRSAPMPMRSNASN
ncbi:hypothetical protein ACHAXR_005698 [Thalassiosira sp. AJA248-18]